MRRRLKLAANEEKKSSLFLSGRECGYNVSHKRKAANYRACSAGGDHKGGAVAELRGSA